MRSRYLDIVAVVFFASPLLGSWSAYGQTASQTPSSADTQGVACAPNGALSYNGNSFVLCTSGAWVVQAITLGAGGTCTSSLAGQIEWTGSALQVCNGSSWANPPAGAGGSNTDVQYNSSGALAGSNNLVWNNTSGFLGIGTAAPQTILDVHTGTNENLFVTGPVANSSGVTLNIANDGYTANSPLEIRASETTLGMEGNVGIGTTSPLVKLHAIGRIWVDPSDTAGSSAGLDLGNTNGYGYINSFANSNLLLNYAGGNVGIGTTSPQFPFELYSTTNTDDAGIVTNANNSELVIQTTQTGGYAWHLGSTGSSADVPSVFRIYSGSASNDYQFVINNSGSVGIGVTSPAEPLDVETTSTNVGVKVGNSQGAMTLSGGDGSNAYINAPSWGLGLQTGGTTRLLITSGGKVGIGSSSPIDTLDLNGLGLDGSGNQSGTVNRISANGASSWLTINSPSALYLNNQTTATVYIANAGGTTNVGGTLVGQTLQVANVEQAYGNYIWPGRNDGSGGNYQTSWYLASNSSWGLYTNTSMYFNGGIYMNQGAYLYPGCDGSCGGGQQSYYLYTNSSNAGVTTNNNFIAGGNIYCGACGNWLSNLLGAAGNYNNNAVASCGTGGGGNGLFQSGQTVELDWITVFECAYNVVSQYSDVRLKTGIKPLPDDAGLSTIMKLKPITFVWRDRKRAEREGAQVGFIAQDVEKLYPQLVTTAPFPVTITKADGSKETVEHPKVLRYEHLTAPLVKAVQQLKTGDDARDQTIASLRARLEQDEREIADLKRAVGTR